MKKSKLLRFIYTIVFALISVVSISITEVNAMETVSSMGAVMNAAESADGTTYLSQTGVKYRDERTGETKTADNLLEVQKVARSSECKAVSERESDLSQSCILCPVFKVLLDTNQIMATKSYNNLAESFRNVIIIILALYIAYQTLTTVSAVTKQDVSKYLGSLMVQSFKVLVAALLLSKADYVYDWVVNPVFTAGLDFGKGLIDSDVAKEISKKQSYTTSTEGVISQALVSEIMKTVYYFNSATMTLPAMGASIVCTSTHAAAWHGFFPDLSMLICGLVCSVFGWMISLACLFYLLDSVVRFGIFCTLLPFFVASWPFKVTLKYAKAGWDIFINAFFNFVLMGLIISLTAQLVTVAMTDTYSVEELQEMLDAANEDNVDQLAEAFSLSGTKFLILFACCIFAFKLVGQVSMLAQDISGASGGSGIGNKIGGLAAQGAKRLAVGSKGADGKQHGGALGVGKGVLAATGVTGLAQGVGDRISRGTNAVRSAIGGGSRTNPNGAFSGGTSTGGNAGGGNGGGNSGSSSGNAGGGNGNENSGSNSGNAGGGNAGSENGSNNSGGNSGHENDTDENINTENLGAEGNESDNNGDESADGGNNDGSNGGNNLSKEEDDRDENK